jgi:hypothetical protein
VTRRFLCLAAIAAFAVPSSAAAPVAVIGEQRALVLLATWGPEPWTRQEVERAFSDADAFIRNSSFGQLGLQGTVTRWLRGYDAPPDCPAPEHERIPPALTNGPDAAAEAAGFRVSSYDRVIYIVPRLECPWLGVGVARQVMLNGTMNTWGIVHELGHTYGLAHAHGRKCPSCRPEEYGDPFSPMGLGLVDFSAYEKLELGWIDGVEHVTGPGRYPLGRPDVREARPHGLVVVSGAGEFWFEQRLDTAQPGLVVRKIEPDVPDDDLAPSTLFLGDPNSMGRPTIAVGDSFRAPGAFTIRYEQSALVFAWSDRTRPRAPNVSAPRRVAVGRSVRVSWTSADAGSGIARCTLSVDRRVATRGEAKGGHTIGPFKAGTHVVAVVCTDRAGNASRPAVRRLIVRR